MKLIVDLKENSYPVYIGSHLLDQLSSLLGQRHYFLLSDDGVPQKWIDKVTEELGITHVCIIPQGEASKSFPVLQQVLEAMADARLNRSSALVALGGGVVGDLGGFAASIYMRGIDFYNIPTTSLSQIDSSVGGKTAIDLGSYKNLVGSFWQPKAVVIDTDTLSTLPARHLSNGLVEALKMGLILDAGLVSLFEQEPLDLEAIITRSIALKADVVSQDEKENGLRRILNFGHTIGHALEGAHDLRYLHGECVAAGMLYFIEDDELRERVRHILESLSVPAVEPVSLCRMQEFLVHDKKGNLSSCSIITVPRAGSFEIQETDWKHLLEHYQEMSHAE